MRIAALIICCCIFNTSYATDVESQIERSDSATANRSEDIPNAGSELTIRAINLIGTKYKYGGDNPETGVDCSGLVRYLFKDVWGTDLPRRSLEISHLGQKIDLVEDLQPGDLVFYNTRRRAFSHVGIYLGDNKFIHAPSSGGRVRIESMDLTYWKARFNGARRIDAPQQENTQPDTDTPAIESPAIVKADESGWQE